MRQLRSPAACADAVPPASTVLSALATALALLLSGYIRVRVGQVINQFVPIFEKHKISAYLNGHDHCNQHITSNGLHYFTSGTAANNDQSTNHSDTIPPTGKLLYHSPGHNGGFASVAVSK